MSPIIYHPVVPQPQFVHPDDLRTKFSLAMSAMYRKEVPLYGDLVNIVESVNAETLRRSADLKFNAIKDGDVASERLHLERHGAVRLGTAHELRTLRRVFAVMGLFPVGYYDLSAAGLPMHATCFRPTSRAALRRNPFRVFTTLLRQDLLHDAEAKDLALRLLSKRNIFSPELMNLLDAAEHRGDKLEPNEADIFVQEAVKIFEWKPMAAAPKVVYQQLKEEHPILADIACFQSAHINHLTPRTLDIVAAQERMKSGGLHVKELIEGPPPRTCPILLRQTSFLALEEPIDFPCDGRPEKGHHKARFGEIEERGAAVTDRGRALYDKLLSDATKLISAASSRIDTHEKNEILATTFTSFPDTWNELRHKGLVYFTFHLSTTWSRATIPPTASLDELVELGIISAKPMTYEDFLPMSAAGIFKSNLGSNKNFGPRTVAATPDQIGFEEALGCEVKDPNEAYVEAQTASLKKCAVELGLAEDAFVLSTVHKAVAVL